jgi:hypothetical protein
MRFGTGSLVRALWRRRQKPNPAVFSVCGRFRKAMFYKENLAKTGGQPQAAVAKI